MNDKIIEIMHLFPNMSLADAIDDIELQVATEIYEQCYTEFEEYEEI